MKTVFSGIQPTGSLHLGNYLGAIKPWKEMIKTHKNYNFLFSIVDLHAITVFQNPAELKKSVLQTFASYIASGINPLENKNVEVFQQSLVPEHNELAWILSCNTPLGWLDRMTQYKDKTKENKERECLGLYAYPCLMAADILLYNTNIVPVGEDQKQHLELTRDIAIRVNNLYKKDIFIIPEVKISEAKRVMSLKDGAKKMSKSDVSEGSRINLTDTKEEIQNKIAKATTGLPESPEVQNLLLIYKEFAGLDYKFESEIRFGDFKKELTELITSEIMPISNEIKKLLSDVSFLEKTLLQCSGDVLEIAKVNMRNIKNAIGF
jgi:tryptophanyl-tRNA synthetase